MAKKNEWTKKGSHKILLPYIQQHTTMPEKRKSEKMGVKGMQMKLPKLRFNAQPFCQRLGG